MKKCIIALFLLMGMWSGANAQDNITTITYQPSIPLGDLDKYIGKTSWLGWGIEGRRFRSPSSNLTFGFSFAWHVFDDKLFTTTNLTTGAVTGTQQRYVNSLPFLLTANYYLNRNNAIKPFIGVGAGAYYIVEKLYIGVYAQEETGWHFGMEGELGLQIPFGDVEGIVSARYHYALASGESITGEEIDFAYLTAVIGLAYTRW